MADLYKCAARGRRNALDALYCRQEKWCWFLCVHLLGDVDAAADVYISVWKAVFAEVRKGGILGQQQFDRLLLRNIAQCCYAKLKQYDAKGFRNSVCSGNPQDTDAFCLEAVISQLTPIERFVFLLKVIGKMDAYDCGKILHLKRHTYHTALASATAYVSGSSRLSKEALDSQLSAAVENSVVPQKTKNDIRISIARFSRDTLWERYKHLLSVRTLVLVTASVAGLSIFLCAALLTYWYIFTTK